MQKKRLILVFSFLVVVLILSSGIISAFSFSDFWNKLFGREEVRLSPCAGNTIPGPNVPFNSLTECQNWNPGVNYAHFCITENNQVFGYVCYPAEDGGGTECTASAQCLPNYICNYGRCEYATPTSKYSCKGNLPTGENVLRGDTQYLEGTSDNFNSWSYHPEKSDSEIVRTYCQWKCEAGYCGISGDNICAPCCEGSLPPEYTTNPQNFIIGFNAPSSPASWTYDSSATISTPCKWKFYPEYDCKGTLPSPDYAIPGISKTFRPDDSWHIGSNGICEYTCNFETGAEGYRTSSDVLACEIRTSHNCIGDYPPTNSFKGPSKSKSGFDHWEYSESATIYSPCKWKCPDFLVHKTNSERCEEENFDPYICGVQGACQKSEGCVRGTCNVREDCIGRIDCFTEQVGNLYSTTRDCITSTCAEVRDCTQATCKSVKTSFTDAVEKSKEPLSRLLIDVKELGEDRLDEMSEEQKFLEVFSSTMDPDEFRDYIFEATRFREIFQISGAEDVQLQFGSLRVSPFTRQEVGQVEEKSIYGIQFIIKFGDQEKIARLKQELLEQE